MADAGHHGKPSVAFLKAIADALQNGYRYRMVWVTGPDSASSWPTERTRPGKKGQRTRVDAVPLL
eukprot:4735941-Amphidinium_carterae.1